MDRKNISIGHSRDRVRHGRNFAPTAFSMMAPAVDAEEKRFLLARVSPSPVQRQLALAVVLALLIVFFLAAGPLSAMKPGRVDAFIPAYAIALFVIDLITAVLLFAQFSIFRFRALLAIGTGYMLTALIAIPWMLTYPGVFAPSGLLRAGLQTSNWLYIFWHASFSTFVIAYASLSQVDRTKGSWQGSATAAIISSVILER